GVERVGLDESFFELGGHSLLATQAVSRLREVCGAEVGLRRLFERPTVRGLSEAVEEARRGGVAADAGPVRGGREAGGAAVLSFAQQRLWFLEQLQPGGSAYNLPHAMRLSGALDRDALGKALSEIVRRHEVLRTSFVASDGEPVQVISPAATFGLRVVNLDDRPGAERERELRRLCQAEAQRPFDLSTAPLLRATLFRLADDDHVLLLVMHHIVTDGWSHAVLTAELTALYEAFRQGRPSPLGELPVQYADYAAWQRARLGGEALERDLGYWKRQLAGVAPLLELPTDRPRPTLPDLKGASRSAMLPRELGEALNALSRREGTTLFMTLLAAFQTLLYRYTGQRDITTGTPIAGRTHTELERLIGFFVNTLVLRTDFSGDPSFSELLARVREVCLGAYDHQDVPFEKLVEELQPERDLSRTPLFQVMFVLQNVPLEQLKLEGLTLGAVEVEDAAAKFDLLLTVVETRGGLHCLLKYKAALFDGETIERMLGHFRVLLEGVAADPGRRVSALPILTEAERETLLSGWNRTARDYARDRTINRQFEEQVARTPDAVALGSAQGPLTFAQLNERANQLAHHLRSLGVGPESRVGLYMARSPEALTAVLAVLKAGGAYVPLDASYPKERVGYMLRDAGAALVLTQRRLRAQLPDDAGHVVSLDDEWELIGRGPRDNPTNLVGPDSLAYVIYTSGSTGLPKGVMVQHRSALNLAAALQRLVYDGGGGRPRRVGLNAPLTFDASVKQLVMLLNGHSLHLIPEEVRGDGEAFLRHLELQGIDAFDCTPSHLEMLTQAGLTRSLKSAVVLVGGEPIGERLWKEMADSPGITFFNVYGPTECTVDATACAAGESPERPVIGRPIDNVRVYVLDAGLQPVPVGVRGELYIAGDGLARGYLNRPALTAEKFIPEPFSGLPGGRMYRTGDAARFLPDGRIEFSGRVDRQVKVRGFRIEPGEVEAALGRHPSVLDAVVLGLEDGAGDKRLVAYVVAEGGGEAAVGGGELQEFLRESLPAHMVPSAFTFVDALPLSSHGKVDVRALPAPDWTRAAGGAGFVAPRDWTELQLAQVWEETLGVAPVGVSDSFFDLGGHSLMAVRMMARARQRLGRPLPLAALFEEPTVRHLARIARTQVGAGREPSLVPLRRGGDGPPLFLVHPVGGRVFCYVELARHLEPGRTLYGLQSQLTEDGRPAHARVEAMAASYLEEVRAVQRGGPYSLGGWSMGGVVAFEMTRQLRARGEEVRMLALIDSMLFRYGGGDPAADGGAEEADEAPLLLSFARDLGIPPEETPLPPEELARMGPRQRLAHLLERARASGVLPADVDLSVIGGLYELFKNNHGAMRAYLPEAYAGRALLIRAAEGDRALRAEQARGWAGLVGDLEVRESPGTHYTMVRDPHAGALAARLQEYGSRLEREAAEEGLQLL
ncbi:MAG TPA: amino acid adenylation domain-containing protein, partial [Pyrinomonadaceae bacterium]|nr:amino acid adenylation domain-containing protein [Pyrinomonadaceae bacterium]